MVAGGRRSRAWRPDTRPRTIGRFDVAPTARKPPAAVGLVGERSLGGHLGARGRLVSSAIHSGEWRNRQTRWLQVPVAARSWGFKSPLAHEHLDFRPEIPGASGPAAGWARRCGARPVRSPGGGRGPTLTLGRGPRRSGPWPSKAPPGTGVKRANGAPRWGSSRPWRAARPVTRREAAALCQLSNDQASRLLRGMVANGQLEMEGTRRAARYREAGLPRPRSASSSRWRRRSTRSTPKRPARSRSATATPPRCTGGGPAGRSPRASWDEIVTRATAPVAPDAPELSGLSR